ncbi:MAG TPA: hypothetical protein PK609_02350 [Candidatus Paceibacterota bacterium]|nr:hypothetical protein [Candidatus Paceibacterota bacterium]
MADEEDLRREATEREDDAAEEARKLREAADLTEEANRSSGD